MGLEWLLLHEVLVDPIWNTLRDNNCFNVIVRQCFVDAEHKGQSVLMNKLQLTTKGAAVSKTGELIQHCIFKLIKPVIFLQVDC